MTLRTPTSSSSLREPCWVCSTEHGASREAGDTPATSVPCLGNRTCPCIRGWQEQPGRVVAHGCLFLPSCQRLMPPVCALASNWGVTSPPYQGLFESRIPAGICFEVGQRKEMSHPAPFPGLGVAAGIPLAGGTPVTRDCCLKRAFLSRAVLVAVGRRAITHANLLTDRREQSFPAGTGDGWWRAGWGRGARHPCPLQRPGGTTTCDRSPALPQCAHK